MSAKVNKYRRQTVAHENFTTTDASPRALFTCAYRKKGYISEISG